MGSANVGEFYGIAAAAAATLVGFLSVANSIIDNKGTSQDTSLQAGILAESAYTAFANVFFVSLIAVEPFINVGYGAVLMSIVGLISTGRDMRRGLHMLARISRVRARVSRTVLLVSAAIYGLELIAGILLVLSEDRAETKFLLVYVIVALNAVGLTRAWELLGVRRLLGEEE
jgi:hypothetical protein